MEWVINLLIGWFIDYSTDYQLIDWMINWPINWLIDWQSDQLIDRLVNWLINWLVLFTVLMWLSDADGDINCDCFSSSQISPLVPSPLGNLAAASRTIRGHNKQRYIIFIWAYAYLRGSREMTTRQVKLRRTASFFHAVALSGHKTF